jgi:hypothetical protein
MYLQIEVGGTLRGIKFNMAAIDVFWGKVNLSGDVEFTSTTIYAAFYAGLVGNCAAKGVTQDFTMEEVSEWVDDLYTKDGGKEDITKVCDALSESTQFKNRIIEINTRLKNEEEDKGVKKKKVSSMKST